MIEQNIRELEKLVKDMLNVSSSRTDLLIVQTMQKELKRWQELKEFLENEKVYFFGTYQDCDKNHLIDELLKKEDL